MSDNTTLNNGTGGDVIRTDEIVDRSTGTAVSVKTQVIKIALGKANTDDGVIDASINNNLPVSDDDVRRCLEKLNDKMDVLIALLRNI